MTQSNREAALEHALRNMVSYAVGWVSWRDGQPGFAARVDVARLEIEAAKELLMRPRVETASDVYARLDAAARREATRVDVEKGPREGIMGNGVPLPVALRTAPLVLLGLTLMHCGPQSGLAGVVCGALAALAPLLAVEVAYHHGRRANAAKGVQRG